MCLFIKILLLISFSVSAFAEQDAVHIYTEKVEISEGAEVLESVNVEDFFRDSAKFNYFENQSLRASSSLLVEGVDQRFLDLTYNGFSLRDPSHPSGIFNINALSGVGGASLMLNGSSGLSVEAFAKNTAWFSASGSNLGEAQLESSYGRCHNQSCRSLGLNLKRGGGFSQSDAGDEDDYFEEVTLSFSNSLFKKYKNFETHFLYYGQRLDEDNISPLPNSDFESLEAESKNSVLFLGQEVGLNKNLKVKVSYLSSYRNQKDQGRNLSFRQHGEVVEFSLEHAKLFKITGFKEDFNLYSSKGKDLGAVIGHRSSLGNLNLSAELTKSEERDYSWNLELGLKNFIFFYKGVAPSLFQQAYNEDFNADDPSLSAQEVLGMRFFKKFEFNDLNFKITQSYSRSYDFIDFYFKPSLNPGVEPDSSGYENIEDLENVFSSLDLKYKNSSFFVQHQISREVSGEKRDQARRPRWTLGLSRKQKISKALSGFVTLKWLSERRAFDQSLLRNTWFSEVRFDYKSFKLSATNVLNKKELFFKDLSRKPLAISLSYSNKF